MPPEDRLRQAFRDLVARFAGAVEYWTAACLSRGTIGDPTAFLDAQWALFLGDVQELRHALAELPHDPPAVVHDQVAKLLWIAADLRDVFAVLAEHADRPREEVEVSVLKLGVMWRELRMRVSLAAAAVPLAEPLPGATAEQDARCQAVLDGLFDKFAGAMA